MQREVTRLVGEVRELQDEIQTDQRETRSDLVHTQRTVERVAAATSRRRRLPRVRVQLER
jgi:hypothetical protein